jgi:hypothetical protein
MSTLLSLVIALQVGVTSLPASPVVKYQFVTAPEGNLPVAICDQQYTCHCPVGYKATMHQATASTEAINVTCEVSAPGATGQSRETFDSYPILPTHENLGK